MSKILLLEATKISHKFDYQLFSNISISLEEKESISIIGRSGSGKSTLLHILSTFLKPDKGLVKLFQKDIYNGIDKDIEKLRRYKLGIIFQFHYLFKGMKSIENIEIGTLLSNQLLDNEILKRLEIDKLMYKKIGTLSGGEQQRVSIARVLNKKPKIIYADEPTGNLDRKTADLVIESLISYTKENNAGLIMVTHDNIITKKCDKIFLLDNSLKAEL